MTKDRVCATATPLSGFDSRHPSRQDLQDKATMVEELLEASEFLINEGVDSLAYTPVRVAHMMARDLSNALDDMNFRAGK